jgi:hypothetical protein
MSRHLTSTDQNDISATELISNRSNLKITFQLQSQDLGTYIGDLVYNFFGVESGLPKFLSPSEIKKKKTNIVYTF